MNINTMNNPTNSGKSRFLWPIAALLIGGGAVAQEPATFTVHADKPGAAVPRSSYGIFFEEVNNANDGGLYAELIQNRSFDAALPPERFRPPLSPSPNPLSNRFRCPDPKSEFLAINRKKSS